VLHHCKRRAGGKVQKILLSVQEKGQGGLQVILINIRENKEETLECEEEGREIGGAGSVRQDRKRGGEGFDFYV